MRVLDMGKLSRKLKRCKDLAIDEIALPEGTDKRQFDMFLRVMRAANTKEIKDISLSELVRLYQKGPDFADILQTKTVFDNEEQFTDRLMKVKVPVSTNRRIL